MPHHEVALRRRDTQQQGLPATPPRAEPARQRSFYSRAWLTAVERLASNAPLACMRNKQNYIAISRAAMQCRLA